MKTDVVIVGAGPSGIFTALELLRKGSKKKIVIVEKGKAIENRHCPKTKTKQCVNCKPNCHITTGFSGAGAFSDGKLFTRSKKRGDYNKALRTLVFHGAKEEILYEAHPHIGTDKLPRIMQNIRQRIVECGGEYLFERKVTDIKIERGRVVAVESGGEWIEAAAFVLATGHSARDIYELLYRKGYLD